jgi:hypothetical protein
MNQGALPFIFNPINLASLPMVTEGPQWVWESMMSIKVTGLSVKVRKPVWLEVNR